MKKQFALLTAAGLLAFSPSAQAQLGAEDGSPHRYDMTKAQPLTDDRIADQVIRTVTDQAELPFVLYEDVKFDFTGICPKKCKFTFRARNGKLTLTAVEAAQANQFSVLVGREWLHAPTPIEFHVRLRRALIDSTSSGLVEKTPQG